VFYGIVQRKTRNLGDGEKPFKTSPPTDEGGTRGKEEVLKTPPHRRGKQTGEAKSNSGGDPRVSGATCLERLKVYMPSEGRKSQLQRGDKTILGRRFRAVQGKQKNTRPGWVGTPKTEEKTEHNQVGLN